jgi:hypothetical protein
MAVKHVALVGAACVTIGWLLASTLAPPVARVQSLSPAPSAPRTQAIVEIPATEQLHARLSDGRPLPTNRRNPFVFATSPRAASPGRPDAADIASVDTPEFVPVATGPAFVLSGIGISGTERTAILAADDAVSIVRINDVIGVFTVEAITDDSITLTRSGEKFILRLAH